MGEDTTEINFRMCVIKNNRIKIEETYCKYWKNN